MKKYIAIATIISLFMSCGSAGQKKEITKDTTTTPAPSHYEQLQQSDLNHIGELYLGMTDKAVVTKFGEPAKKSAAQEWGADGMIHQDWEFPAKGIAMNMAKEKDSLAMRIFSISITKPCEFKTKKNIGIGAAHDEVMKVYTGEIDTMGSDENIVIVGSLYGGIIFEFTNKKVSKIFVGAAAE